MNKIETGCAAIILKSSVNSNIGKIVKVGLSIGKVDKFDGDNRWEISPSIMSTFGILRPHANEDQLQRLDISEKQAEQKDTVDLTA